MALRDYAEEGGESVVVILCVNMVGSLEDELTASDNLAYSRGADEES